LIIVNLYSNKIYSYWYCLSLLGKSDETTEKIIAERKKYFVEDYEDIYKKLVKEKNAKADNKTKARSSKIS